MAAANRSSCESERADMTANEALRQAEERSLREPEDEDENECRHEWKRTGKHHDGTEFFTCKHCGRKCET